MRRRSPRSRASLHAHRCSAMRQASRSPSVTSSLGPLAAILRGVPFGARRSRWYNYHRSTKPGRLELGVALAGRPVRADDNVRATGRVPIEAPARSRGGFEARRFGDARRPRHDAAGDSGRRRSPRCCSQSRVVGRKPPPPAQRRPQATARSMPPVLVKADVAAHQAVHRLAGAHETSITAATSCA